MLKYNGNQKHCELKVLYFFFFYIHAMTNFLGCKKTMAHRAGEKIRHLFYFYGE